MRLSRVCFLVSTVVQVHAWTLSSNLPCHRSAIATAVWATDKDTSTSASDQEDDPIVVVPQASYGVSFMGGDPCGSKYNDDPFDATKEKKPGIPDDMKARIAALAEQKKKEAEAAKQAESESN